MTTHTGRALGNVRQRVAAAGNDRPERTDDDIAQMARAAEGVTVDDKHAEELFERIKTSCAAARRALTQQAQKMLAKFGG